MVDEALADVIYPNVRTYGRTTVKLFEVAVQLNARAALP